MCVRNTISTSPQYSVREDPEIETVDVLRESLPGNPGLYLSTLRPSHCAITIEFFSKQSCMTLLSCTEIIFHACHNMIANDKARGHTKKTRGVHVGITQHNIYILGSVLEPVIVHKTGAH